MLMTHTYDVVHVVPLRLNRLPTSFLSPRTHTGDRRLSNMTENSYEDYGTDRRVSRHNGSVKSSAIATNTDSPFTLRVGRNLKCLIPQVLRYVSWPHCGNFFVSSPSHEQWSACLLGAVENISYFFDLSVYVEDIFKNWMFAK